MNPIQLAAVAIGIPLGVTFAAIWHFVARSLGKGDFWQTFARTAQQLISGEDEGNFIHQYLSLLSALVSYVGKMLFAISLASLPVGIGLYYFLPIADAATLRAAQFLEIHSPDAASIQLAGRAFSIRPNGPRIPLEFNLDQGGELFTLGGRAKVDTLEVKHAFSASLWQRVLLSSLGFRVAQLGSPTPAEASLVILRPSQGDDNLLWPYVNDLEFLLLIVI